MTLNHIVGLPTFFSKGDNPNLEYDNSRHILPVCNKTVSGCNKHRMIILATYSQCQTGLKDVGSQLIICLTADNCKPYWVKKHRVEMKTYSLAGSRDAGST